MPTISIYLPDDDAARLNKIAADENRSASNAVATLVREGYFKRYAVQGVSTLPAPAGAKAVVLVDVAEAGGDETVVYEELDAGA
jgi:hypothetical protein